MASRGGSESRKQNSYERSHFVKKMLFLWTWPLFYKGYKKELELNDLSLPPKVYLSHKVADRLEQAWFEEEFKAERRGGKASLWRALIKTFAPDSALYLWYYSIAILVIRYLRYLEGPSDAGRGEALAIGALLALSTSLAIGLVRHSLRIGMQFGMSVRIACSALLYRKILRVNFGKLGDVSAGKMVNVLSNDVSRFDTLLTYIPFVVIAPLHVLIMAALLYCWIGWYALVGLGVMMLQSLPAQAILGKLMAKFRSVTAIITDQRMKKTSEIFSGIKLIKMYAWEKPLEAVVGETRRREIFNIRKMSYIRAILMGYMIFGERFALYCTLLAYSLSGNPVTASMVFSLTQYFSILNMTIAFYLSQAISNLSEVLVSIKRIEELMHMDEREDLAIKTRELYRRRRANSEQNSYVKIKYDNDGFSNPGYSAVGDKEEVEELEEAAVEVREASSSWKEKGSAPTLKNISLKVRRGQLCMVVGNVGSGKSSLLQLLLGEMALRSGGMRVSGEVSFASQEPWLFAGSIRENVLFGLPFEAGRYARAVAACALDADLAQIAHGDLALVGERGVSLSGGQRARINLARAVYRKADVYLLDDPLSAVDAAVGRHLFDVCIRGFLEGTTRILVTHQLHHLRFADLIIVLNDGAIEKMGTYEELFFCGFMAADLKEQNKGSNHDEGFKKNINNIDNIMQSTREAEVQKAERKGTNDEGNNVFLRYIRVGNSSFILFLVLFLLVFGQTFANGTDYWICVWTSNSSDPANPMGRNHSSSGSWTSTSEFLYVYTALVVGCVVFVLLRGCFLFEICLNSSKRLHDNMFHSVLYASPKFFDHNPSGRILNRFSKDIGQIDELLPVALMEAVQIFLIYWGSTFLISLSAPWSIAPASLVVLATVAITKVYLRTSQPIKRIEGITKSPVFSHLSTTLNGIATIRCTRSQDRFIRQFDHLQDVHTSVWLEHIWANLTLGFWADCICQMYLTIVIFFFLIADVKSVAGYAGLAISQGIMLSGYLQQGLRQFADMMALLTSVERVIEYTYINTECHFTSEDTAATKKPEGWPNKGAIRFEGVKMRYEVDQPYVLDDINLNIEAGWKVGIVGRTGAGKSSLVTALFRLAPIEGRIEIDGLDISKLSLKDLRSSISIIPQEPVLFSASIRYNLDPFDRYDDAALWKALEEVKLKEAIPSLQERISQGGGNLSAGQRQLVCLARAILADNKILVMDEATANVDPETDDFIQRTIRRRFGACTVLTIAHRLNTVMDSDRLLTLSAGRQIHFDHPHLLLGPRHARDYLSRMLAETDSHTAEQLRRLAKRHYLAHSS